MTLLQAGGDESLETTAYEYGTNNFVFGWCVLLFYHRWNVHFYASMFVCLCVCVCVYVPVCVCVYLCPCMHLCFQIHWGLGVLFFACIVAVYVLIVCPPLSSSGRCIGIAFQLIDDLLDVVQSSVSVSPPSLSPFYIHTHTYIYIYIYIYYWGFFPLGGSNLFWLFSLVILLVRMSFGGFWTEIKFCEMMKCLSISGAVFFFFFFFFQTFAPIDSLMLMGCGF